MILVVSPSPQHVATVPVFAPHSGYAYSSHLDQKIEAVTKLESAVIGASDEGDFKFFASGNGVLKQPQERKRTKRKRTKGIKE